MNKNVCSLTFGFKFGFVSVRFGLFAVTGGRWFGLVWFYSVGCYALLSLFVAWFPEERVKQPQSALDMFFSQQKLKLLSWFAYRA